MHDRECQLEASPGPKGEPERPKRSERWRWSGASWPVKTMKACEKGGEVSIAMEMEKIVARPFE